MIIRLESQDSRSQWECELPYTGASYVNVTAIVHHEHANEPSSESHQCSCGDTEVRGSRGGCSNCGAWSDAVCNHCGVPRGRLVVSFETIFGVDEDARVFTRVFNLARIYGGEA